jgi:fibronectin type 3 domain-containing protein
LKPTVAVKNGNTKLVLNKDYKLTYASNIKPGTAKVKINFINNYTGSVVKNYTIAPAKVKGQKQTSYGTKNVSLTWNKVTGVSGYEIYRSSKKNGTYSKVKTITGTTNKYTHNKLKSGTVYYYKIRAFKKSGTSYIYGAFSNVMSAITKPAMPTIKVVAGTKRAVVSWSKVTGAKGYEVYMATSRTGQYTKIATRNATTTKVEKRNLTAKKNYYFKVRAYTKTAAGKKVYSGYSSIKSVKVK